MLNLLRIRGEHSAIVKAEEIRDKYDVTGTLSDVTGTLSPELYSREIALAPTAPCHIGAKVRSRQ